MTDELKPATLEEAWDLLDTRRFLHGHRESLKESFEVIMKDVFVSPSPAKRHEAPPPHPISMGDRRVGARLLNGYLNAVAMLGYGDKSAVIELIADARMAFGVDAMPAPDYSKPASNYNPAEQVIGKSAEHVVPTHRHKKRGSAYALIGIGKMQAENWEEREYSGADEPVAGSSVDMRDVAIYRSIEDGSLWVRPREEFEDGRFEALSSSEVQG